MTPVKTSMLRERIRRRAAMLCLLELRRLQAQASNAKRMRRRSKSDQDVRDGAGRGGAGRNMGDGAPKPAVSVRDLAAMSRYTTSDRST